MILRLQRMTICITQQRMLRSDDQTCKHSIIYKHIGFVIVLMRQSPFMTLQFYSNIQYSWQQTHIYKDMQMERRKRQSTPSRCCVGKMPWGSESWILTDDFSCNFFPLSHSHDWTWPAATLETGIISACSHSGGPSEWPRLNRRKSHSSPLTSQSKVRDIHVKHKTYTLVERTCCELYWQSGSLNKHSLDIVQSFVKILSCLSSNKVNPNVQFTHSVWNFLSLQMASDVFQDEGKSSTAVDYIGNISVNDSSVVLSTCDHAVSDRYTLEHLLDEPNISARLQVADTFLEDGGEDAPHLSLTGRLTLVQQLHHAHNALGFLDDEIHLQVKLATDQLEEGESERQRERGRGTRSAWIEQRKHLNRSKLFFR